MKKGKVKKNRHIGITRKDTGERFIVNLNDTLDLTEEGMSKFFKEFFEFAEVGTYLCLFYQKDVPMIMLKAMPEQMNNLLVAIFKTYPEILEHAMKAIDNVLKIYGEKAEKVSIH